MAGTVEQAHPGELPADQALSRSIAATGSPQAAAGRLAALEALGRRVARPSSPAELICDAMSLAAKLLEADLWGSAQVVVGGKLVVKIHSAGRGEAPEQPSRPAIHTIPLAAEESLAGKAIGAQASVSVKDLQLPAEAGDEFLRKLGVRAAVVVPIFLAGEPYGAVAVYRREPHAFSPDQTALLETMACWLTPAIGRAKAEEALSDQRQFVSTLLETIDTLVLVLDVDGNVEGINRACRELAGFALPEIRDKPFCSVFAVPEEEELFRKTFRRSVNNKKGCRFESTLLAKDGTRHHIAWSLKVVIDKNSFVQAILLTGTDQTRYAQVCDKLKRAETVARDATSTVRELRRQLAEQPLRGRTSQDDGREASQPPSASGRQSAQPAPDPSGADRRRSPRRPYRYRQLVAPVVDDRMPAAEEFCEVECEDISAGGLSFYYPERPEFTQIVVALGQVPFLTHFKAEVIRVADESDETGSRFLVGCRFTGRVDL